MVEMVLDVQFVKNGKLKYLNIKVKLDNEEMFHIGLIFYQNLLLGSVYYLQCNRCTLNRKLNKSIKYNLKLLFKFFLPIY